MSFVPLPTTSAGGISLAGASLGEGDLTVDAWGSQKVSLPYSVFHGLFTFDIPPSQWFMYHNGTQVYTGTNITSTGGAAKVTCDSTVTTALLESRSTPRYQPNRGHLFSTAVWCPSKTAGGTREWGLQTAENGVFFRLKSDGKVYAVLRSDGVETKEELIDTSGVTGFDVEKGNVYDIQFQWRGVGDYKFFINLVEVHVFANLGTLTALSVQNPALPAAFKCTYGTTSVSIYVGCVDISSENGNNDRLQYGSVYADQTLNGTDKPLIVVYNPLTINGKTNTRDLELSRITLVSDKKSEFKVWASRSASSFSGATLVARGNGSFVQTDSTDANPAAVPATAVNTALMSLITVIPTQANIAKETNNPFQTRIDFQIVRGDYLIITGTATTAACEIVVEWGESI